MEEASRFGIVVADGDGRITEFQEKPPEPKSNLASMGIYSFQLAYPEKGADGIEGCAGMRFWKTYHPLLP
mgnify:CR=1 FL=1